MKVKKKTKSPSPAIDRIKAEKSFSQHPQRAPKLSPGEYEKLIGELEAQNQEIREKQREIEEVGRRYRDLYDFAPIGYFVLNQRGTILESNLQGARMLGLPRNQVIGTPFGFFLAREFLHRLNQHLKEVFSSNTKQACELEISQRFQKSVRYVSIESTAIDKDKSATCRSAVIDITERKLSERDLARVRQELVESNAQLRRVSARLLQTQEEERSRVAGDVHDSFTSQLCVIKDQLQFLLGKGEDARLNYVLNQLDTAVRDAIRIQKELRPPTLDDLGLLPTLSMLCREFQDSHSNVHVEKKFLLKGEVPDSIEVPVYRIAQEAFENIAAHSGADSVTIALTRKDSVIEFVIRDNGHGFDVKKMLDSGVEGGLSAMKERATLSGGLLEIESKAGKGTTLRVSWPFALNPSDTQKPVKSGVRTRMS